jgi:hypothetical protein
VSGLAVPQLNDHILQEGTNAVQTSELPLTRLNAAAASLIFEQTIAQLIKRLVITGQDLARDHEIKKIV